MKLQVFLTWAMDGCKQSDYALVPLNPGKEHTVPGGQEVGGLQTWVWTWWFKWQYLTLLRN
jgi:hypothetical protein